MTVVGIDLGTSNSALAFTIDTSVSTLEIAQVESPGQVARHVTMPSALYLPMDHEITAEECRLPWQTMGEPDAVIGRWRGESGRAGAVTLVWGRPRGRGAVAALAGVHLDLRFVDEHGDELVILRDGGQDSLERDEALEAGDAEALRQIHLGHAGHQAVASTVAETQTKIAANAVSARTGIVT